MKKKTTLKRYDKNQAKHDKMIADYNRTHSEFTDLKWFSKAVKSERERKGRES